MWLLEFCIDLTPYLVFYLSNLRIYNVVVFTLMQLMLEIIGHKLVTTSH